MPNWVRNVVIPKDYKKFAEFVKDEQFDFNQIIPQPNSLNITSPAYYKHGWLSVPSEFQTKRLDPVLNNLYAENVSCEKFVKTAKKFCKAIGLDKEICKEYNVKDEPLKCCEEEHNPYEEVFMAYFNVRRYGYSGWFDWRCDKWGTKWNAAHTYVTDTVIEFDTAWSTPMGIWKALAKKFDFVVMYADEDTGSNCGIVEATDGIVSCDSYDYDDYSIAFANCVWSGGEYEYESEEDEDNFIPDEDSIKRAKENYNDMIHYWREQWKN